MTQDCQAIKKKIEHWLELSEAEKDAVRHHASQCPDCMPALSSLEPVLHALDQSATSYDRITYSGPMPLLPDPKPAPVGLWPRMPKLGWATALVVTICVLVWFGSKSPVSRDVAGRPSTAGALRIPAMPSRHQAAIPTPISLGAMGRRIPKPHYPIGPSLHRHLQMPKKPDKTVHDPWKDTSMRQQVHT